MTRETYDKAVALQTEIFEIKQLINDCKEGQARIEICTSCMHGTPWNLYGVPEHQDYKRPEHFDEMVEYSRKLAAPFKFVRCDFYEVDGLVYLGEMTFTPGACAFRYKNDEDNIAVGDLLTL